jgi:hypothetical protein
MMMLFLLKRSMSHGHGGGSGQNMRNMIQCIIPNPPGFQATNSRISSKHSNFTKVESSIILDHSDQTSKVLVTYPDNVKVKVDVFYETLSTIGFLHGDLVKAPIVSYSLFGRNKPWILQKK